jgi:sec-independent protein translocase protein TatC
MPPLDQIDPDSYTMSFGDHLEELRSRVIKAVIIPIPLMIAMYPLADDLLAILCEPLRSALRSYQLDDRLQVLGPAEALMTQIKISVLAAIALSTPWILWQAWQFIRPGLYKQERRFVYFLIPGSFLLSLAGIAVFYFLMLPFILLVLVGFGTNLDEEWTFQPREPNAPRIDPQVVPRIPILPGPPEEIEAGMWWITPDHELIFVVPKQRGIVPPAIEQAEGEPVSQPESDTPAGEDATEAPAGSAPGIELELRRIPLLRTTALTQEFRLTTYVDFVLMFLFGMIIAFQTPLVMLLLGWMNLASVDWLRKRRKHALFITAIAAAVITPTVDPWSMLAMWIPMYLLFEFGIVLMRWVPASRVSSGSVFDRRPRRTK